MKRKWMLCFIAIIFSAVIIYSIYFHHSSLSSTFSYDLDGDGKKDYTYKQLKNGYVGEIELNNFELKVDEKDGRYYVIKKNLEGESNEMKLNKERKDIAKQLKEIKRMEKANKKNENKEKKVEPFIIKENKESNKSEEIYLLTSYNKNKANYSMKIVSFPFGDALYKDENGNYKTDKIYLASGKVVLQFPKNEKEKERKNFTICLDLNKNSVCDVIISTSPLKVKEISKVELLKAFSKKPELVKNISYIIQCVKDKKYEELEKVLSVYPDLYSLYLYFKNNKFDINEFLKYYEFYDFTTNANETLNKKELQKNKTQKQENTNISTNLTLTNTSIPTISSNSSNQSCNDYLNFNNPKEVVFYYYKLLERSINPYCLFDDKFNNIGYIKDIHEILLSAYPYLRYNISNIQCYDFENEIVLCKYHLKGEIKDRKLRVKEIEGNYLTFIDNKTKKIINIGKEGDVE
jgi:hypothetical protein